METAQMVLFGCVIILLVVGLTYLYKWLNGDSSMKDFILYSSSDSGLPAKSSRTTDFNSVNVPPLYAGGEFSVSTWIYVTNWGINKGKNKPFLQLSGGGPQSSGYATLVMYLGQFVNKLGIRVSHDAPGVNSASSTLDYTAQMPLLLSGTTPYSDTSSDFKKCDIETVDLQKWVNITAVLSGRTLDVYIDGKLSRSCVLDGMFKVDGDNASIKLGGPNGFGGLIGKTRAANFAYSPDRVYKYYQEGPFSGFTWRNLNPAEYSLDIKKDGKSIFSTSTGNTV
jgi:hypothetical protein